MQVPGLKRARERAYLTQAELAAKSDVAEVTINRLEKGHRGARVSTIRKLAAALAVSPDDLTGLAEEERAAG